MARRSGRVNRTVVAKRKNRKTAKKIESATALFDTFTNACMHFYLTTQSLALLQIGTVGKWLFFGGGSGKIPFAKSEIMHIFAFGEASTLIN